VLTEWLSRLLGDPATRLRLAEAVDSLVGHLEAAKQIAAALVQAGDSRFAPMVENLGRLASRPRNERLARAAYEHASDHLPFFMDRGNSWTESLTPAMQELVDRLGDVRRMAVAASPRLQAMHEAWKNPAPLVLTQRGHQVVVARGALVFDGNWKMPALGMGATRLSGAAPEPYLLGQTAASLWIADLRGRRWARIDIAPGLAKDFSFLEAIVADREKVAYQAAVLETSPSVQVVLQRKQIAYAERDWRTGDPVDPRSS
jgi:hypothetical protein